MAPSTASDAALALIGAAASASSPAPARGAAQERQRWLAGVTELAAGLYRQAQALDVEISRLAETTPIAGVILSVEEVKGRGLITLRPTVGSKADDPDATEPLRTPWLTEPAGASLFAQARALIGRPARMGKYYETGADGRRFRMVAWIESAGPVPADAPPAATDAPRDERLADGVALLATGAGETLMARVNALGDNRARLACRRALVAEFGPLDSIEAERLDAARAVVAGFEGKAAA